MASDELPGRRNSNSQLLEELETLSNTLYQSHITSTRRTASLAIPRSAAPSIPTPDEADTATYDDRSASKPRSRRMSLSPWRSRPKDDQSDQQKDKGSTKEKEVKLFDTDDAPSNDKKGIWKWKPMRALSHIGMQKLSCLFSVEVVAAQGLPTSMNGLRLSVCVRKKETKDSAVNTMPARVSQGAADFEETLFVKCHVYCSQASGSQQLKYEPRPFLVYVFAVDAAELDFGRSSVDLSRLIQESIEKSAEGARIRQWDTSFDLAGKAKGGQLLLKLGFQIMEKDGGTGLFSQLEGVKPNKSKMTSSFGRKQSKSSFSIPSPKMSSRMEVWTPSQAGATADIHGIDDLNLDEPAPAPKTSLPEPQKRKEAEEEAEELDIPDFEIVDKGVEIESTEEATKDEPVSEKTENGSTSSEVVKEVVHDHFHLTRLTELDSLAQQIKALESMMSEEHMDEANEDAESQRLDAEEENVTFEFLQMLEDEDGSESKQHHFDTSTIKQQQTEETGDPEAKVFLPDLGKGLGCVVQTRNEGFLAAMNPSNVEVSRKETPKLAMQMSKPFVLSSDKSISGFELFQRMAAVGLEELSSQVLSLMPIEELMGKTAEQVAFEGIRSAIISGRNKEGASSTAARSLATVKKIASAMSTGRKERVATGIWNVGEDPLPADDILPFSIQKIEAMVIDALKVQAEMAEDDAPFDVSPLGGKASTGDQNQPLEAAIPLDDWTRTSNPDTDESTTIIVAMAIQLRDPLRRYEAVGGPLIALINATPADSEKKEEDIRYKVTSLHVAGMKVQTRQNKHAWDTEKQRLTAMQWLLAYNMGRAAKKRKSPTSNAQDKLWSISSMVVADMWLKSIRNPDVKFTK